jgi:uncharacterized membrane protein YwaF
MMKFWASLINSFLTQLLILMDFEKKWRENSMIVKVVTFMETGIEILMWAGAEWYSKEPNFQDAIPWDVC